MTHSAAHAYCANGPPRTAHCADLRRPRHNNRSTNDLAGHQALRAHVVPRWRLHRVSVAGMKSRRAHGVHTVRGAAGCATGRGDWATSSMGRSFALSVTVTSPLSIAGRSEPGTIRQIKGVGTVVFEQEAVPRREQRPDGLKCLCVKRLCRVERIGLSGRAERSLSKRGLLLRERRDFQLDSRRLVRRARHGQRLRGLTATIHVASRPGSGSSGRTATSRELRARRRRSGPYR